jgi:protocatechuate 3,4-dioxygenase beta subunit
MREFGREIFILGCVLVLACSSSTPEHNHSTKEIVKQDDCDNPDKNFECCFVNMPSTVTNVMTITKEDEKGEHLIITGTVFGKDDKTPASGVFLYAYQTDITGRYTKTGSEAGIQKWHGRLHGWCKTGSDGKYEILTIRPASYPNSTEPAHIHMVVKIPGGAPPFYINDFVFTDDPFVNASYRSRLSNNPGGPGEITLTKQGTTWYGTRDITFSL